MAENVRAAECLETDGQLPTPDYRRRWRLAGLLVLAAALVTGCDLPSLVYFITTGLKEPMEEAGEMKLAEKAKEVKVVILTYAGLDMRPGLMTVGRDLGGQLARQLQNVCRENSEKVIIVSPTRVNEYLANHPNWYLKPEEVGKHFGADKVIYLEVDKLSLYEPGSANQLFRGRASLSVKLWNLSNPDDIPVEHPFSFEYPSSRGPIPADGQSEREFYQAFLSYLVKHLSWKFTAHPLSEAVGCD
jgi:hypothetical protein